MNLLYIIFIFILVFFLLKKNKWYVELIIVVVLLLLVVAIVANAEEVQVMDECNLKARPSKNSKVLGRVGEGYYKKIKEYAHYWLVELVDSKTGITNKGWVWVERVGRDTVGYYITGKGVTIRENSTNRRGSAVGYIFPGSRINKVYGKKMMWYKIRAYMVGWVYGGFVEGKYCTIRKKSFEESLWEGFKAK